MARSYIGDIGTAIIIDMGRDISSAIEYSLIVKKPGTSAYIVWLPELYGTNYLKYVVLDGDFSIAGRYTIQPSIKLPSWQGNGEPVYHRVYGTI